jgi:hypothetical protein
MRVFTGRQRKSLYAMAAVAAAVVGTPLTASAESAWAWAHNPTAASYSPFTQFSFNSGNGPITIQRSAVGRYTVDFGGLNVGGGNVQVTSYGSSNDYCKVLSWGGSTLRVSVNCFSSTGAAADALFVVVFSRWTPPAGFWVDRGYFWNNNIHGGTPHPDWTSVYGIGAPIVETNANNDYIVRVSVGGPFVPGELGLAHVTGYGEGNAWCSASGIVYEQGGATARYTVRCRAPDGVTVVPSRFSTSVARFAPLEAPTVGYAATDNIFGETLAPDRAGMFRHACNAPTGDIVNTRLSKGRYRVRFPNLDTRSPRRSAAMVTTRNATIRCQVQSWGHDGAGGTNVDVACANVPSNTAEDTLFSVSLVTDQFCVQ